MSLGKDEDRDLFLEDTPYDFDIEKIEELIKTETENLFTDPNKGIVYNGREVSWSDKAIVCPICPKKPLKDFSLEKIFDSAKKPILITCNPETAGQEQYKFMFKYGDDLRQDNLVLQMFKMMDRIWEDESLGIDMITYDVMETGFEIGMMEFVQKS